MRKEVTPPPYANLGFEQVRRMFASRGFKVVAVRVIAGVPADGLTVYAVRFKVRAGEELEAYAKLLPSVFKDIVESRRLIFSGIEIGGTETADVFELRFNVQLRQRAKMRIVKVNLEGY